MKQFSLHPFPGQLVIAPQISYRSIFNIYQNTILLIYIYIYIYSVTCTYIFFLYKHFYMKWALFFSFYILKFTNIYFSLNPIMNNQNWVKCQIPLSMKPKWPKILHRWNKNDQKSFIDETKMTQNHSSMKQKWLKSFIDEAKMINSLINEVI